MFHRPPDDESGSRSSTLSATTSEPFPPEHPEIEIVKNRAAEIDRGEPLQPARLEPRHSFGRALPWKQIAAGITLLTLVTGGYVYRARQERENLRSELRAAYEEQLEAPRVRVQAFRDQLIAWIQEAGQRPPSPWADRRLNLSNLHDAAGLYLRLHAADTQTAKSIVSGAMAMAPDAITRCLGLAPTSVRGLFERSGFLQPEWLKRIDDADSLMKLRVVQDELTRRIERDLPLLANIIQSDYFLLTIQHGEQRRDAPVDVFLWDLRQSQALLRVRTQASGVLLPVHIAGTPPSLVRPRLDSGAANDCSIATQVKQLTGEFSVDVSSRPPSRLEAQ
ncbi:MAG: hypothetical protein AAF355_12570 [Myxococcota bacterium]